MDTAIHAAYCCGEHILNERWRILIVVQRHGRMAAGLGLRREAAQRGQERRRCAALARPGPHLRRSECGDAMGARGAHSSAVSRAPRASHRSGRWQPRARHRPPAHLLACACHFWRRRLQGRAGLPTVLEFIGRDGARWAPRRDGALRSVQICLHAAALPRLCPTPPVRWLRSVGVASVL